MARLVRTLGGDPGIIEGAKSPPVAAMKAWSSVTPSRYEVMSSTSFSLPYVRMKKSTAETLSA